MRLVKFNPVKIESLFFSRRINLQDHPTLFFNDVPIQEIVSHYQFIHLNVVIGKPILILLTKKTGHD